MRQRYGYVAAGIALLLLYSVFLSAAPAGAKSSGAVFSQLNASNGSIGSQLNQTAAYLQQINESGYLIFEPSLGKAYAYYYQAVNISAKNPNGAIQLLDEARQSAQQQQQLIYSYRGGAFAVMAVLTAASVLLLFYFMKPRRGTRQKNRQSRRRS